MPHKVKIINSDADLKAFEDAVESLGDLGISECRKIVIIPALESPFKSEQSGVIVRTKIVEYIVQYLRKRFEAAEITIVCSAPDAEMVFRNLGYYEVAQKHERVALTNLNSCEKVKIMLQNSKILGPIEFPQELIVADAFVYVGTLRRHIPERIAASWMLPLCAITNPMLKLKTQTQMGKSLFDLNTLTFPSFCVIDAETALDGTGPIEGRPRHIGKLIISAHPLAADMVAAKMVSEKPKKIPHLKYAMKQLRFGESDIQIEGEYLPTELSFIPSNPLRLWKLGLFFRRFAYKIENLGNLFMFLSLALISVGMSDLVTGRWVSVKDSLSFASNVYKKIYEPETLLDRKVIINRHVKEQSVS